MTSMISVRRVALGLAAAGVAFAGMGAVTPALAGEGHWSIGKGVQCKIVLGVVVCSKTRP